ncbi:MAG: hypothetical protein Q9165_003569 [Trypethelium subeluteriae]
MAERRQRWKVRMRSIQMEKRRKAMSSIIMNSDNGSSGLDVVGALEGLKIGNRRGSGGESVEGAPRAVVDIAGARKDEIEELGELGAAVPPIGRDRGWTFLLKQSPGSHLQMASGARYQRLIGRRITAGSLREIPLITSSLTEAARKAKKSKNNAGHPVRLNSKILTIIADPDDGRGVYVAESAGTARRISLQSQNKAQVYSGPAAPLASLSLSPRATSSSSERTLFAGCWDKTIWSWSTTSRAQGKRFIGHNDFVKAVVCVQVAEQVLLVSGGADAQIIVWDVTSGAKLHTLKGHTRGVLDLAIDPLSADEFGRGAENVRVFSAGSERDIRAWQIDAQSPLEIDMKSLVSESGSSSSALDDSGTALLVHETSVNRIFFPLSDTSGDFWTASSDKTAKHIVRSRGWEADTVLDHPDFVRDICYDEASGYVVTACRDEGVRVWDPTSGNLVHCFAGHFEEVTALVVLGRGVGQAGEIVSVSIDGTIRRWGLGKEELQQAKEDAEKEQECALIQDEKPKASMLTEEEERELAELMEDEE